MRKLIIILFVILSGSCKQKQECYCLMTDDKGQEVQDLLIFSKPENYKKAKNECYEYQIRRNSSYVWGEDTLTINCTIRL